MKTKKQYRGGVIIEVLIASLIFATSVLALVEFQANLLRSRTLVNQQSEALTLAQNKMQYFRSYTALTNATSGISYTNGITTNGTDIIAATTATYNLQWSTTTTNATTNTPANKNVTITTTWTDPDGTSRTVSINSIIAAIDPIATGKVSESLP